MWELVICAGDEVGCAQKSRCYRTSCDAPVSGPGRWSSAADESGHRAGRCIPAVINQGWLLNAEGMLGVAAAETLMDPWPPEGAGVDISDGYAQLAERGYVPTALRFRVCGDLAAGGRSVRRSCSPGEAGVAVDRNGDASGGAGRGAACPGCREAPRRAPRRPPSLACSLHAGGADGRCGPAASAGRGCDFVDVCDATRCWKATVQFAGYSPDNRRNSRSAATAGRRVRIRPLEVVWSPIRWSGGGVTGPPHLPRCLGGLLRRQ